MKLTLDPNRVADYLTFLNVKRLPSYSVVGRTVEFPDEYAADLGIKRKGQKSDGYIPIHGMFDYQRAISELAIQKRKYAVFMECGLGKTLVLLEFARHAAENLPKGKAVLIVSPLMVVQQTIAEAKKFYGDDLPIEQVKAAQLPAWIAKGSRVGITNYESLTDDLDAGRLGALILDESSLLKSHYGKWGATAIRIGKGLSYKLALTGTPAPNDRIEYATHAVFLDQFPTVNSFLARYFVNRGQTQERWELKPHALKPFYRSLSHWSIFLTNPATYGWKDNATTIPPIKVHIHEVGLTTQQREIFNRTTGQLFAGEIGGIVTRSALGQISKGNYRGEEIESNKPAFIRSLIDSWPDESTLVWCIYNSEQRAMEKLYPNAASITGESSIEEREILLGWFCGRICTCERQKRIASICKSTTRPTSIDGISAVQKSRLSTTRSEESNTQPAKSRNKNSKTTRSNGKNLTRGSGSINECGVTELPPKNMTPCPLDSFGSAQSADSLQAAGIDQTPDCTLTIATQPDRYAACCASIATTGSASLETIHPSSKRPLCICELGKPLGRIMISKARVLGFGLNLQIATRQVFSGLQDSYEQFHQCVKRSNRVGSTKDLNVHIPVTELERPMIDTVLRKAKRIDEETREQEEIFKNAARF